MIELKILLFAVILDFLFGDPYFIPHPIVYIGKLISYYEKIIRKALPLKIGGFVLTIGTIITVTFILTIVVEVAKEINIIIYYCILIYLIYTSLAAKCLKSEAMKIHNELIDKNILNARKYLSYIVGRDTTNLNEEEIIRGTVETVSENTIDGVLAPMIYLLIGLLIGYPVQMVFIYKTINTLDSMVGYKVEPYKEIGYASAKLDDIVNFIPGRIGSIIMLLSGGILGFNIKNGNSGTLSLISSIITESVPQLNDDT